MPIRGHRKRSKGCFGAWEYKVLGSRKVPSDSDYIALLRLAYFEGFVKRSTIKAMTSAPKINTRPTAVSWLLLSLAFWFTPTVYAVEKSYQDGSKYVGEMKDGKRHGKGTYTQDDGSVYEGDFKDGKHTARAH